MVYVLCRNAQLNIIVIIMPCICIVMRSLFVNCPAVNCSPNMLVMFYGETPLVNCGPRSILSHWLNNHKLQTVPFFILCNLILIFHTRRLILCFQQAGEIDNLTVSLGQSTLIVLCAGSTLVIVLRRAVANNLQKSCCSYWFDNLGFILRENLLLNCIIPSSWGLPTNVWFTPSSSFSGAVAGELEALQQTATICSPVNSLFLAPLPGSSSSSARGVSHFQSLYFVFVLLSLFYFILFAFNYQKHKN